MSATEPLTPISGCVTQGRSLSVQWRRDTANHKKQEQTKKKSRKSSAARHPDGRDKLEASPSRSREQQRITIKNPTKKKKGIHCQRINLSITHHQAGNHKPGGRKEGRPRKQQAPIKNKKRRSEEIRKHEESSGDRRTFARLCTAPGRRPWRWRGRRGRVLVGSERREGRMELGAEELEMRERC